jgi:hypothetical protein
MQLGIQPNRATVIGMDSSMMGTIMVGMVLIGMGLSFLQLIAELVARGRRAEFQASRDEVLKGLYAPPQPAGLADATPAAPPSKAGA